MTGIRTRLSIILAVLLLAIVGVLLAFNAAANRSGHERPALDARLLTDPQPDHGKDCPYPPPGSYGSGKSGKVAPGRDKHCNG
jgi:hypothetical protein